ncbi:MAG: ATP-dependent 6-phosphofructokinase [Spirochaetales bacterium]|nr:ATP-dependent 6-phosphofructokinase [Spirochaetales bacterium]
MPKLIGILTSGGDTPGLNAAIRAVGKSMTHKYNMKLIGIHDGFRGLMENRFTELDDRCLSGILTRGGTILGSSRDKPHKMPVGGKVLDMTDVMVENYNKNQLSGLICLGGGGTQKNAYRLAQKGLNVMTLPKTIDNDVANTDRTFGYDTALMIATEAIDRLHSTAHSHHRVIIVEIMGHKVGWLALGAGVAGGADVILIPELAYDEEIIAEAILKRRREGKRFSIVAVAEGAVSKKDYEAISADVRSNAPADLSEYKIGKQIQARLDLHFKTRTGILSQRLESLTRKETRVTILGHLQRGGAPTAHDRILATSLGTKCAAEVAAGNWGNMIAVKGSDMVPVPLEEVAGIKKFVPTDHPLIISAQDLGISLGI